MNTVNQTSTAKKMWTKADVVKLIAQVSSVVVIFSLAGAGAYYIMTNRVESERVIVQQPGPLVTVARATPDAYPITVTGFGSIRSETTALVVPQVSGVVEYVHPSFKVGGFIPAGEVLIRIDDSDYLADQSSAKADLDRAEAAKRQVLAQVVREEAGVSRAEANYQAAETSIQRANASLDRFKAMLKRSEAALSLIEAEAETAILEWKIDRPDQPVPALVAREPQLEQGRADVASAKADVQSARADLENAKATLKTLEADIESAKANLNTTKASISSTEAEIEAAKARMIRADLNVKRTSISLPFDAVVNNESVELGQMINMGQSVADVYDPNLLEVAVPLADRDLVWFRYPGETGIGEDLSKGAPVRLTMMASGEPISATGYVSRTERRVDPIARTVSVVVTIDQSSLKDSGDTRMDRLREKLFKPGGFVRADITGEPLEGVYRLPRSALRDNSIMWVVDSGSERLDLPMTPAISKVSPEVNLVDGSNDGMREMSEGLLSINEVEIIRTDDTYVYVKTGLLPGQWVITSSLDVVTEGMRVRPRPNKQEPIETKASADMTGEDDEG